MNIYGGFDPSVEFTGPPGTLPRQIIERDVAKAWDIEFYYAGILFDAAEGAVGGNPSPNYIIGMEEINGADPNVPFAGPAPIPAPTEEVRGWQVNAEVDIEYVELQLRTVPTTIPAPLGYGAGNPIIALQLMNIGNTQYAIPAQVRDVYILNSTSPNLALFEAHQLYQLTAPLHFDPGDFLAFRIFELAAGLDPIPGDLSGRIY